MSGTRLIPSTDDAEFPYDQARRWLLGLPAMESSVVDFPAMIEAGKRFGWTNEMIESHWGMMARGKCFSFAQAESPHLQGTMYEDNIFFTYTDGEHEDEARPEIERLAKFLRVRILEH